MCGITGIIDFANVKRDYKSCMQKMLEIISHRGPDKLSAALGKNFFLGTARLAIEALRAGGQPFVSEDKNTILVFNGEIFNYKKLIDIFFFKSKNNYNYWSEGKLLLELYRKKGKKFISYVEGQFAIAIYNKVDNELILYRDRFGIRPLFYYLDSKSIYFSSEIKSMATVIEESLNISKESISQTSMLWTNYGKNSAFEKVFQVKPGCLLSVKKKKLKEQQYYTNDFYFLPNKKFEKEINVRSLISDSIKSQLQSEVGYGCYVSGGIDSSVIAYELGKISRKKIDTFSIEFENKEYDESKKQKKLSEFIKSNHSSVLIKNSDIYRNFLDACNHAESILFRTAPIPLYILSKLVNEKKHKVVFSGEGADEVFLGYDIFFEAKIRKFWQKDLNSEKRSNLFKKIYHHLPQFKNERYFQLTKDFYKQKLSSRKNLFFAHEIRWLQFDYLKNYFECLNESRYNKKSLIKKFRKYLPNKFEKLDYISQAQLIEFETLLANYLLSSQGDRMSMAHSIEVRYPYLDENLINTVAKIKKNQIAPTINSKKILRDAYKNILPKEIVKAEKIAYQAPESQIFFSNNKYSELATSFLDYSKQTGLLNYNNFKQLSEKIVNSPSNFRMGFRENLAYIMGMSIFCLNLNSKSWRVFSPKMKKIEIKNV